MEEPNQRRNGADEDIEEVEDELLKEMEQDIEYRIGLAEEIERRTNQYVAYTVIIDIQEYERSRISW